MNLVKVVIECSYCHQTIFEGQEYARMKINGEYRYFHNRYHHGPTDCYGEYLLKHLQETKGIQAT